MEFLSLAGPFLFFLHLHDVFSPVTPRETLALGLCKALPSLQIDHAYPLNNKTEQTRSSSFPFLSPPSGLHLRLTRQATWRLATRVPYILLLFFFFMA